MDEDEECLHENSGLNIYLQNLGFSDVQVTKDEAENPANKFKISRAKSKFPVEAIDKDVIDQVEVITSTKLVFEEDISVVEILLSNFKIVNNGILKIMFQDLFGVAVIFLGLCLYFTIGYYALVIISPFYAYKCADYFNRKHFVKIKLKCLIDILQKNSSLLKESLSFINKERNRLLLFQVNNKIPSYTEGADNFYFYGKFRSDFLSCVNEMTNILVNSTQKLIKSIPLIDYADTPVEYYLCNNFDKNFECNDPSKVYLLYLLVQSEFLRRIILSLIPNINLSPKINNCKTLKKILGETSLNIIKIKRTLKNKFNFAFYYGSKGGYKFKIPERERTFGSQYKEEFICNIQDISNTFTDLLMKCRLITQNVTSDKVPNSVESELVALQTALNDCQRNIEKSFILLRKAMPNNVEQEAIQKETIINNCKKNNQNSSPEKANTGFEGGQGVTKLQEEEIEISCDNLNKITVGYTDLDTVIEDDVFQAFVTNENQITEFNSDELDFDEVLNEKLKMEFSQNVMKELKIRLVEKAKSWKKREINILKKKGLIDNSEELLENWFEEVEDDNEPKGKNKKTYFNETSLEKPEMLASFKDQQMIKNHFLKSADRDISVHEQLEPQTQHYFGGLTKEFLKALNDTRKLIFTTPLTEEEFCLCTTEDEGAEEDFTDNML